MLAVVALVAAAGAGYRYFQEDAGLFGPRVEVLPEAGPVGVRPFVELRGFPTGREVTVYLCRGGSDPLDGCVELATGVPGEPVLGNVVPSTFPGGEPVGNGAYVLRAGPDEEGNHPVRGSFEVVPFTLGPPPDGGSLSSLDPAAIRLGPPREVARGAPCRPPTYMPDGRLVVGTTVVDPRTGVTIELGLSASELAWSPAGEVLAILTGDEKEIRLAQPDGTDPVTRVREARGLLNSLTWSAEGDRLAFVSRNDPNARGGPGPPTVRILNAINGEVTSAGPALTAAWSPTGDLLAIERADERLELSTPQGGRRDFIDGARPVWSADGRLITTVRNIGVGGEGWIALADGSRQTRLVQGGVCGLALSPTGANMAITVAEGDETSIVLRKVERQA